MVKHNFTFEKVLQWLVTMLATAVIVIAVVHGAVYLMVEYIDWKEAQYLSKLKGD